LHFEFVGAVTRQGTDSHPKPRISLTSQMFFNRSQAVMPSRTAFTS